MLRWNTPLSIVLLEIRVVLQSEPIRLQVQLPMFISVNRSSLCKMKIANKTKSTKWYSLISYHSFHMEMIPYLYLLSSCLENRNYQETRCFQFSTSFKSSQTPWYSILKRFLMSKIYWYDWRLASLFPSVHEKIFIGMFLMNLELLKYVAF
jgi:hypothetical protein